MNYQKNLPNRTLLFIVVVGYRNYWNLILSVLMIIFVEKYH